MHEAVTMMGAGFGLMRLAIMIYLFVGFVWAIAYTGTAVIKAQTFGEFIFPIICFPMLMVFGPIIMLSGGKTDRH